MVTVHVHQAVTVSVKSSVEVGTSLQLSISSSDLTVESQEQHPFEQSERVREPLRSQAVNTVLTDKSKKIYCDLTTNTPCGFLGVSGEMV